jgi:hypothetical protein
MKKFDLATCTLCLRFFASPLVIVGLLAVIEIAQPTPTVNYTQKVGISLAMYGIGSLIPYFLSDEILHRKFATVSTSDGKYSVTFVSKKEKEMFDLVKVFLWVILIVGFVLWIVNNILPMRLSTSQPYLANWLWLTGVVYCLLAGAFYVFLSVGPSTNKPTSEI